MQIRDLIAAPGQTFILLSSSVHMRMADQTGPNSRVRGQSVPKRSVGACCSHQQLIVHAATQILTADILGPVSNASLRKSMTSHTSNVARASYASADGAPACSDHLPYQRESPSVPMAKLLRVAVCVHSRHSSAFTHAFSE